MRHFFPSPSLRPSSSERLSPSLWALLPHCKGFSFCEAFSLCEAFHLCSGPSHSVRPFSLFGKSSFLWGPLPHFEVSLFSGKSVRPYPSVWRLLHLWDLIPLCEDFSICETHLSVRISSSLWGFLSYFLFSVSLTPSVWGLLPLWVPLPLLNLLSLCEAFSFYEAFSLSVRHFPSLYYFLSPVYGFVLSYLLL